MLIEKEEMLQVGSSSCYSLQPDTQRVVIVQWESNDKLHTAGARFISGKGWKSATCAEFLLLPPTAVWTESIISE